jgi:hypothetical protein
MYDCPVFHFMCVSTLGFINSEPIKCTDFWIFSMLLLFMSFQKVHFLKQFVVQHKSTFTIIVFGEISICQSSQFVSLCYKWKKLYNCVTQIQKRLLLQHVELNGCTSDHNVLSTGERSSTVAHRPRVSFWSKKWLVLRSPTHQRSYSTQHKFHQLWAFTKLLHHQCIIDRCEYLTLVY